MYWEAFGLKNEETRSLVHIFPVATGITSPYPVTITLSVFTRELGVIERTVEHGRCGQPGGIWWEDLFPELATYSGFFGCAVKINSKQSHILLNASQCIFELFCEDRSTRYIPAHKVEANIFQTAITSDPRASYSIVLLNTSQNKVVKAEAFLGTERISAVHLPANATHEIPLVATAKDKPAIVSVTCDGALQPYLLTRSQSQVIAVNCFTIYQEKEIL